MEATAYIANRPIIIPVAVINFLMWIRGKKHKVFHHWVLAFFGRLFLRNDVQSLYLHMGYRDIFRTACDLSNILARVAKKQVFSLNRRCLSNDSMAKLKHLRLGFGL